MSDEKDSFFIELPVDLSVPYRNCIITGILPAPQPTLRDAICTLCGRTGAEHVGVDGCPVDNPRGGFEFL